MQIFWRGILSIVLLLAVQNLALATSLNSITELPNLGSPTSQTLSQAEENTLGKQFMQAIWQTAPILNDPVIEVYIESLGKRLTEQLKKKQQFHFFVLRDNTVNAFAGPGGYIGINSGLILFSRKENDLTAVMAHEIAHVLHRHIAQTFAQASQLNWAGMIAMLAAAAASTQNANLGSAALAASIGGIQQHRLNFSRAHERDADQTGIELLHKANIPTRSMAEVFQEMQDKDYSDYNRPEFLSTHPLYSSRIAESYNQASKYPKSSEKNRSDEENLGFHLIQERVRVETTADTKTLLKYYQGRLSLKKINNQLALEYGYALALLKTHQDKKALRILTALHHYAPDKLLFAIDIAAIATDRKQTKTAVNLLKALYQTHSNYYPLILQYSDALAANNETKKSIEILKKAIELKPNNYLLYARLSRLLARTKEISEAYIQQGKAYELLGDKERAIQQLQQAKKQARNRYKLARINATLKRLKKTKKGA